ncbi:MAG TPA: AAA family ATPase [Streptosporangiaceae bacterium]|nr:AAA family ATPase [Streptosporangiaceae bacterium]
MPEDVSESLFGRAHELAVIRELLGAVPGSGAALLVRGRPGVGRSRLIRAASITASSRQIKVQTVTATRQEAGLPFAGLHQVVQPLIGGIGTLPAPQRDAVLTAFGMSPGADPNLLFVALGTLALLTRAADGARLALLVDDAQWLDAASSEVLAIIARRLESTPVILIAAARTGYETPLTCAGIRELAVPPLASAAAHMLLDALDTPLNGAEREQILANSDGNPLALVELSDTVHPDGGGSSGTLPTLPALTPRLVQAFGPGDHALPQLTRTLLVIAAACESDSLEEVLAAAAVVGAPNATGEALEPAAAADLIEISGPAYRFAHLLSRSAVYYGASYPDRKAAHAALAAILSREPERAAWHAAATVTAPDETAAAEMDRAARRALRTGGVVAALAITERAVTLSADPALRGGRLLRAAELAWEGGHLEAARRFLAQARPLGLNSCDRTRLMWLHHETGAIGPDGPPAIKGLVELAGQAAKDGDHHLALSILDTAALRCANASQDQQLRQLVVTAARAMRALSSSPRSLSALALADPDGHGEMIGRELGRLSLRAESDAASPDDLLAAGVAATFAGDPATGASFLAKVIAPLRAQGRLRLLARALILQAWNATCRSDWTAVAPAAEEGIRLARETEQPMFVTMGRCSQLMVAALRGNTDAARSLIQQIQEEAARRYPGYWPAAIHAARGLSALSDGMYEEAYEYLQEALSPEKVSCHYLQSAWAIADLAEAAAFSNRRAEGRACVDAAAPTAEPSPSPLLRAALTYARLMLARDDEAEHLLEDAVRTDLAAWPFLRARALLAYGAWLRRQRRITESRKPLREALWMFDSLEARPWAHRTRQELRAAGGADVAVVPGKIRVLSAQELQIAEMAASGMTNRQIGQQLYLSHRTVATHLYRIYPKLGINSRFQMPRALRELAVVQAR